MCRFLIYKGNPILMSDMLLKAEQSLIPQSHHANEREEPRNGDGFGVGWYNHKVDAIPCVFTSIQPTWSNRNLFCLTGKISSHGFLRMLELQRLVHISMDLIATLFSTNNCCECITEVLRISP